MDMKIGDFLLRRLHELGINHLFGVPGDYNLAFLEQVEAHDQLQFIGNCNELNAAYAADGYARVRGCGCLLTTYGVGDLSALSGVAGAYAEHVPVVLISGTPPLQAMLDRALLHHTLMDGNYDNVMIAMAQFTVAQARITVENAAAEIDRVLLTCFRERRPVYLQLPSDLACLLIEVPETALALHASRSDPHQLSELLQRLQRRLAQAAHPVVLVDIDVARFGLTQQVQDLVEALRLPFASMLPAKAVLDENHWLFLGTYVGAGSAPAVRAAVEHSDCIISLGACFSDVSTGLFSQQLQPGALIQLHPYRAQLDGLHFNAVTLGQVLDGLACTPVERTGIVAPPHPLSLHPQWLAQANRPLSQARFWTRMGSFIRAGDVVIAENGTSSAGLGGLRMPPAVTYISQPLWGAIGYTLPALLGTQLAQPSRRHLLFIGDGSLQMTVQELSSLMRLNLKPVIFLINNDGYTIERLILGENAGYNDINPWRYAQLPGVLDTRQRSRCHTVHTEAQLDEVLSQQHAQDELLFIEVVMERMDAPESLRRFAKLFTDFDYGVRPPCAETAVN
ncbi:thiamine pyrophosphate-binding protein [Pseudomonas coleopterorum]|uniref:alpha-keto acid decarboxylase family protein n=1 Tax=Pseudomonas coleopterorum TaxID=1605838 RepID=UPI002A6A7B79|nr:thiamine pyrophosphate-binding protein [Pseudomonas coleopterorum]MDY1046644.1 thiamine pyrophosphate-binding protein [Pseudomonas coleopterorum]